MIKVLHALMVTTPKLLCCFVHGRGIEVWRSHGKKITQRHARSVCDAKKLKLG